MREAFAEIIVVGRGEKIERSGMGINEGNMMRW